MVAVERDHRRAAERGGEDREAKERSVEPRGARRQRAEDEARGPRPEDQGEIRDGDPAGAFEQVVPAPRAVEISPRPVVDVEPDVDGAAVGPESGDDAEPDAEGERQSGKREPRAPVGPQTCLPPEYETGKIAECAPAGCFRFGEVAEHCLALIGIERTRCVLEEPPVQARHVRARRGFTCHGTLWLTRVIAS